MKHYVIYFVSTLLACKCYNSTYGRIVVSCAVVPYQTNTKAYADGGWVSNENSKYQRLDIQLGKYVALSYRVAYPNIEAK
jgi:hypothetical protein